MNKYELALVVSAKLEDEERSSCSGESQRLHYPLQRRDL